MLAGLIFGKTERELLFQFGFIRYFMTREVNCLVLLLNLHIMKVFTILYGTVFLVGKKFSS